MKLKSGVALVAASVGGTLLMQNILNGNMQKVMKTMLKKDINVMKDLEDMM